MRIRIQAFCDRGRGPYVYKYLLQSEAFWRGCKRYGPSLTIFFFQLWTWRVLTWNVQCRPPLPCVFSRGTVYSVFRTRRRATVTDCPGNQGYGQYTATYRLHSTEYPVLTDSRGTKGTFCYEWIGSLMEYIRSIEYIQYRIS
mgnify:CR=1 FL=1